MSLGDRIARFLSRYIPVREITRTDNGVESTYLTRFELYAPEGKDRVLYLHRFTGSDPGNELHNHPFRWSVALLLWGSYEEFRFKGVRSRVSPESQRPEFTWNISLRRLFMGCLNIIRANDYHRIRIKEGKEVWTLFYGQDRVQEWGFLNSQLQIRPYVSQSVTS